MLINRRNIGGTGTIKRLWWVEEQEQDWEKEEGDFETFLRSLLLSLAGVYASGNVLQCGPAADWLESDGCLCWPEIAPPLPLPKTQPPAALNSTCTRCTDSSCTKRIVNVYCTIVRDYRLGYLYMRTVSQEWWPTCCLRCNLSDLDNQFFFFHALRLSNNCFCYCRFANVLLMCLQLSALSLLAVHIFFFPQSSACDLLVMQLPEYLS